MVPCLLLWSNRIVDQRSVQNRDVCSVVGGLGGNLSGNVDAWRRGGTPSRLTEEQIRDVRASRPISRAPRPWSCKVSISRRFEAEARLIVRGLSKHPWDAGVNRIADTAIHAIFSSIATRLVSE